jgi:hypothetical protein
MKFNQRPENPIAYNFGINNICRKNQLNGPNHDPILTEIMLMIQYIEL